MADFNKYFPILLSKEGGYVNDPTDRGAETNKGLTIAVFKENAQKLLGIAPTSANLKALTDKQASILYKALYWDRINGDKINNQSIANFIFDWAVNSGVGIASKKVQGLLGIPADGVIGDFTVSKINSASQEKLFNDLKESRRAFFKSIVQNNPSQIKYLNGWIKNRVDSFTFQA